jgi:preprotein translocase subunit SecD
VLLVLILAMGATIALQKAFVPKFGLDLAGGTTVTLSPVTPDGKAPSSESIDRAVTIIRARVNGTGISDAEVARANDNIVISIPGAGQQEALRLVATTAELRMRQVLAVAASTEQRPSCRRPRPRRADRPRPAPPPAVRLPVVRLPPRAAPRPAGR